MRFTFKELAPVTARLKGRLDPESYRALQAHLLVHPTAGAVMRQTGGWRKIRWAPRGRGKRGGVRVVYYFLSASDVIYFADLYAKGEKEALTPAEKKALKRLTTVLH